MHINAIENTIIKTHLKVTQVVDGDGLIVVNIFNREEEEIRLLGIDAPEITKCRKLINDERETHMPGQMLIKLGLLSMKHLLKLAPPATNITLLMEPKNQLDKYGRILGYIILPDGSCLNERMVADGFAKPYSQLYCSRLPTYQELSFQAKRNKKGLFSFVPRF